MRRWTPIASTLRPYLSLSRKVPRARPGRSSSRKTSRLATLTSAHASPALVMTATTQPPHKKLKMTTTPDTSLRIQPMRRKNETITLLPAEQLLRSLLLDCRQHLVDSGVAAACDLEIWFTGGWVRDRLLGISCSDIDIALSSMTGKVFGEALEAFFKLNEARFGERAQELGVDNCRMSGLTTTKQNLRKSKQLETTIGKVFGLDIDIVNLRKEVYQDDSRTPEMQFGTAKEDAFRRDATVNALFFNIHSQQVVDLTDKGLQDMEAAIIRTPLEPRQTFMDDPLRVLRLIRIGSKLGYTIDDETTRFMKDETIHQALTEKVSRERVGIELFKALKHANPQLAFGLIFEANLYATVFLQQDPSLCQALTSKLPSQDPDQPWPATWPRAYMVLASLDAASRLGELVKSEDTTDAWIMAAYAPVASLRHTKARQAVETATESIKMTGKMSKLLEAALRNVDSIRSMVARTSNELDLPSRSAVGMTIRSWGPTWKLQLLYSFLAQTVHDTNSSWSITDAGLATVLRQYNNFLDFVMEKGLEEAYKARPILDGNAVMELFGVSRGGTFMKAAMDELIAWQFDNQGKDNHEAEKWLQQQRARLGVPPSPVDSQK